MDTYVIETAARKLSNGYVYTYHWLRYNVRHNRYEALRILWAAHCWLQHVEIIA